MALRRAVESQLQPPSRVSEVLVPLYTVLLNMFNRALLVGVSALAVFAAATPNPENAKRWGAPPPTTITTTATSTTTVTVTQTPVSSGGSCNTGSIQCCKTTMDVSTFHPQKRMSTLITLQSKSAAGSALLGLLGIVLEGLDVLLGADCSPISVVGVGSGNACNASPVCCENNSFVSLSPYRHEFKTEYVPSGWSYLHWMRPHHALSRGSLDLPSTYVSSYTFEEVATDNNFRH